MKKTPIYFLLIAILLFHNYLKAQIVVGPGACKIMIDGILFNKDLPVDTLQHIKEGKLSVFNSLNHTYTSIKEGNIFFTQGTKTPALYNISNGRITPELIKIMRNNSGNRYALLFKDLYYKNGNIKAKFSDIHWDIKK